VIYTLNTKHTGGFKLIIYIPSELNASIKYAILHVLNTLGVPFKEVKSMEEIKKARENTILLPETFEMNDEELKKLLEMSNCSILITGDDEGRKLRKIAHCNHLGKSGCLPPSISGILKAKKSIPFYYKFPLLKSNKNDLILRKIILQGKEEYDGVFLQKVGNRTVAVIAPKIFETVAYLLSGSEATLPLTMKLELDYYERMNGKESELARKGFLEIPIVNYYEKLFLEVLLKIAEINEIPLIRKWYFPLCKEMALCLTHDVDEFYKRSLEIFKHVVKDFKITHGIINGLLASSFGLSWLLTRLGIFKYKNYGRLVPRFLEDLCQRTGINYDHFCNIQKIAKIERMFNAHSSFFFLVSSTQKNGNYSISDTKLKEVMRYLDEEGFEIGLHGSYYSGNNEDSLSIEKDNLEAFFGKKIYGVRQHFLRMKIPETWIYQSRAGFIYDTTYSFAQIAGFRASCCLPYHPFNFKENRSLPILEIPLILHDITLFSYMGLTPKQALDHCKKLAREVYDLNGILTLLWHIRFDDATYPYWNKVYEKIIEYCSFFDPWYATAISIAKWWNARSHATFRNIFFKSVQGKNCLIIDINSKEDIANFSLEVFLPKKLVFQNLIVNGRKLPRYKLKSRRLLFFFDLKRGKNSIRIVTNAKIKGENIKESVL